MTGSLMSSGSLTDGGDLLPHVLDGQIDVEHELMVTMTRFLARRGDGLDPLTVLTAFRSGR